MLGLLHSLSCIRRTVAKSKTYLPIQGCLLCAVSIGGGRARCHEACTLLQQHVSGLVLWHSICRVSDLTSIHMVGVRRGRSAMERVTHLRTCAARCNALSTVSSMAWMGLPNGYFVDYWHASQHVTVHGTACFCSVGTQATSFGETVLAVCASVSLITLPPQG